MGFFKIGRFFVKLTQPRNIQLPLYSLLINHSNLFIGSAHVTQEEILNYSTEDFIEEDQQDQVDNGTPAPPPMTDDSSDEEDEIDLVNPYE